MTELQRWGHAGLDSHEDGLPERLIGITGEPLRIAAPRRGDMRPAIARLGDFLPAQLLLATDFDGTLAPIVSQPADARPLPASIARLDRLIELGVQVAVLSGRALRDLRERIPVAGLRLLGENGLGDPTDGTRRALDRFNRKVGRLIARQPGVWLECKPGSSSLHYRNAPDAGPAVRAIALSVANRLGLVAAMARKVVEVRPQRADKALALSALILSLQPKAIIYAGDDEPDHGAFRMLSLLQRPHLTVGVSSDERPVSRFADCDLVVEGPEGMAEFLHRVLELVSRRGPA